MNDTYLFTNGSTMYDEGKGTTQKERETKMKEKFKSLEPFSLGWFPNQGKIKVKIKKKHPALLNYDEGSTQKIFPFLLINLKISTKKDLNFFLEEVQ